MFKYGICVEDSVALNLNHPTTVIYLRAGDLLKSFYTDEKNTVYRVFLYEKNKLKLCETLCSCRSTTIGIVDEGIWNYLIAIKNVQSRIKLSLDSSVIDFIKNIKLNDRVLIRKDAIEDAEEDCLCTVQCITQSSDYPGYHFGVIPLKGNDKELPLLYTVSADYVMPTSDENIKNTILSLTTENNVDEDSSSVVSSEQDFEDGGISEISNQESKKSYHKSLLDSLQLDEEFTEWWRKERVEKSKPLPETVPKGDNGFGPSHLSAKVSLNTPNEPVPETVPKSDTPLWNGFGPSYLSDKVSLNTPNVKADYLVTINENAALPPIKNGHFFGKDPNNNAVALCNGLGPSNSSVKDSLHDSVAVKENGKSNISNGHAEEVTSNTITGTIKKTPPPRTNFSFTKKRMISCVDDPTNFNLQPAKIVKEDMTTQEWQNKKNNQTFYDTIRIEESKRKIENMVSSLEKYKTGFDNFQLNEKCLSDYRKVKGNIISIEEFVHNLKQYKEEDLAHLNEKSEQFSQNMNRRLEIPRTLPSIRDAIYPDDPNEVLELPLKELKISSNEYALNKEESERIKANLPLFHKLLFENPEVREEKVIEQPIQIASYTGTIKKISSLNPNVPSSSNNLPEKDFWNYNSITKTIEEPPIDSLKNWTCVFCTFINDMKNVKCEMCNNIKEMTNKERIPEVSNNWICSLCTFVNVMDNENCDVCDNEKTLDSSNVFLLSQTSQLVNGQSTVKEPKPSINEHLSTLINDTEGLQYNKTRGLCSICGDYIRSGRGVILRDCLHTFCLDCIHDKIIENIESVVVCPHNREYECSMPLQDREIKSIVGDEFYEKYLLRSIEKYQQSVNAIFCKSYKCIGWWEPNSTRFEKYAICPVCRAINCSVCNAIHGDKFCPKTVRKWETVVKKPQQNKQIVIPPKKITKKDELTRCSHPFQCPSCHKITEAKNGILMQCNHACCENCLIEKIKKSCDKHIICPTQKKKRICKGFLNEQAIKSLLPVDEFKKYINRRDTWFKCKNPDCGLMFAKKHKTKMHCPFCKAKNCFKCDMAHENNCFENK